MEAKIDYLYTTGYCKIEKVGRTPLIVLDVRVHALADKYDIPTLKKLASSNFASRAASSWHNNVFEAAIKEVYAGPQEVNKQLRETIVQTCVKNAKALYSCAIGLPFREAMSAVPEFACDFAAAVVKRLYLQDK